MDTDMVDNNDFQPMHASKPLITGILLPQCDAVSAALDQAINMGYDYICTPAYHDRYHTNNPKQVLDSVPADCRMPGSRWATCVVGYLSPRCVWPANPTATSHHALEAAWRQELSWAAYLGVPAVLLPETPVDAVARVQYARLAADVAAGQAVRLWVPVPLVSDGPDESGLEHDTWRVWNAVRCACDHSTAVSPALVLGSTLPSQAQLLRWIAEPVKAVIISTDVFLANTAGYPVLPKAHQAVLQLLHRHGVQAVVSGAAGLPATAPSHAYYAQYLKYCASQGPPLTPQEQYEGPYYDKLQAPLQPLADDLECGTYEVFEHDTPKYQQYQHAMEMAMRAQPQHKACLSVMVVGAGRGPLVLRALAASLAVGRPVRVIAVEKNHNAVVTLREMHRTLGWGDTVNIVAGDMRNWRPGPGQAQHADILISELLGSFGDNELSPECLDGVIHVLAPKTGVCIPQAYTSFLAPVSATKAWCDARAYREDKWLETPYVCKLSRACVLDVPQPAFTFTHAGPGDDRPIEALCAGMPAGDAGQPVSGPAAGGGDVDAAGTVPDNRRRCTLRFTSSSDAMLHGIIGYFDCTLTSVPAAGAVLDGESSAGSGAGSAAVGIGPDQAGPYQSVRLSTHPANHTPGMSSWFPIFFPLRQPMAVSAAQAITVHMWRCVSQARRCVWYEWAVSEPVATHVHNANGSAYVIRL